ncbi:hypothetical protein L6452_28252 [Arctium lappa]|uniref:Uncharacterized protein n=1 Tax=Arctium lappa TaxID=4217 RepID=A0ACB8ZZ96_ARCLA|nr:hypothetical protein L6452_28252 [Arctium lappa]
MQKNKKMDEIARKRIIWWWVRREQRRYVNGEARHGQGIVGTRSIVISSVENGRGLNTELVTVMDWEGHAFATSIAEC